MDNLIKKLGIGITLIGVAVGGFGCSRFYLGANDPVLNSLNPDTLTLNYEQNAENIKRDFEDAKRQGILEEVYPLTIAGCKF